MFTRDNIPQMDLSTTSTGERATIRAIRDAIELPLMRGDYPLVFTRDNIPQTDLLIILTGEGIPSGLYAMLQIPSVCPVSAPCVHP